MSGKVSVNGQSLVQHAIDAVNAHIRSHSLRVGDALPGEAHFAGELGVSRAVMREAFGALAALRLLDVGNGRRARVGAIDGAVIATSLGHAVDTEQVSIQEVWEVRRTIERRTAMLAAANRSEADAGKILALADAMADEAGDLAAVTRLDIEFHKAIAHAGGNRLFEQIVNSFEPLMHVAVPAAWRTRASKQRPETMLRRHQALAKAIAKGDPEAAGAAMDKHFDAAVGDLLSNDALIDSRTANTQG